MIEDLVVIFYQINSCEYYFLSFDYKRQLTVHQTYVYSLMRQTAKTKKLFLTKKKNIINPIPLNCLEKMLMDASKTEIDS